LVSAVHLRCRRVPYKVAATIFGLSIILGFIDTVGEESVGRQAGRGGSEEGQEDAPAS
jgi:hypothetical protein